MKINRNQLFKIYWRLQNIIVPQLKPSVDIFAKSLKEYVNEDTIWLDLGCGHQILPKWHLEDQRYLQAKCQKIVCVDYDMESLKKNDNPLKIRGDITKLPFKDDSFNMVSSNMVIEHLDKPLQQMKEIYRILMPGGLFIFHTPNIYGYTTMLSKLVPEKLKAKIIYLLQGRLEEDVFPTFYRLNTRRKIEETSKKS